MSAGRTAYAVVRRVGAAGRIALVLALLAALWLGTVQGVERASREADDRRAADRSAVATGFAGSIAEWLDAGRTEALGLSELIGSDPVRANQAISTYLARERTFTRDALVFSGRQVVAASARLQVLVGLVPKPCVRVDESGKGVADRHLEDLIAATAPGAGPVVSPVFEVPGECRQTVGIGVATGGATRLVVVGDVEEALSRISAGSLISDSSGSHEPGSSGASDGTRIFLVTGDLALEPHIGIVSVPPRVTTFLRSVGSGGPRRTRYAIGGAGDAEVLAAYAPVTPGWSIVLEQDAAVFDIELQHRPSLIVASVLTIVFAVVFALLAMFDIRRRRAHRRAEVAKNAFFSIAGHELRTPLTSLKGFAEVLSTRWNEIDETRRKALVERMVPQTRRLDRLVERLLVAASIQAETYTRLELRGLDPVVVLEDIAARFRPEAPLHRFIVMGPPSAFEVNADAQALDQVVQHLVDNAVKYSPTGGDVRMRVENDRRDVVLIVEDDGVGLPSDHRHIFEKFVQGESVTKRVHDEGGVGLGLFIVRTLVEEMGGTVRAEPSETGGARFLVSLKPTRRTSPSGLVRSG